MDAILALLTLGLLGWGIVGLVRPKLAKLPDRFIAGIVLVASFLPVSAAIEFYPAPGQKPASGSLLTWALLTVGFVGAMLAARHSKQLARRAEEMSEFFRPATAPTATPKPSMHDEIAAIKRMKQHAAPAKPAPAKSAVRIVDPSRRAPDSVFALGDGEWGETASFFYVDAEGRHSERLIYDWHSDGIYVRGICAMANESRTFRKDRMTNWLIH